MAGICLLAFFLSFFLSFPMSQQGRICLGQMLAQEMSPADACLSSATSLLILDG